MMQFAHIVNPVNIDETSDLFLAQPVTFESMKRARAYANGAADVTLLSAQYAEDRSRVPPFFNTTEDLERSVMDVGTFQQRRKLPLIKDILDRLYHSGQGEYLIFTNVDISLMPSFYVGVKKLVGLGHDAFIINRRTVSKDYTNPNQIELMYAQAGSPHPGYDCFVFKRSLYPSFDLGNACIGADWVGKVIAANLICHAQRFRLFTDLHLTFHLGDERAWKNDAFGDYDLHNRNVLKSILDRFDMSALPADKTLLTHFLQRIESTGGSGPERKSPLAAKLLSILKCLRHNPQ